MNKFCLKSLGLVFALLIAALIFTGCYSVFSGGTGGLVVDAESTSNPKAGIANVDVYAYVDKGDRDSDFSKWKKGSVFSPSAEYYGHTTTGNDGSFTISKLVWKSAKPDFGKDADYTKIYLLFYNENYGLTSGETVIISDSSTDTVYQELTAVRKTTALNMRFIDVASGNNTGASVYVTVSVPQATEDFDASPKVYDGIITGAGNITVSYPRWFSENDKAAGKEYNPEVTVTYAQSGDTVTWKGCYNADNEDKNYAFCPAAETGIKKTIKNSSYLLSFYGKSTRLNVPPVSGQYKEAGTADDDGVLISLKQKDKDGNYTIDLGQTTTSAQAIGTNGTEKHGVFSGLGSGSYWLDSTYTGKFSTVEVEVSGGSKTKKMTLRSDIPDYTVQLQ